MNYGALAEKSLKGELPTREECRAVLSSPDEDILALLHAGYRVRKHYHGQSVQIHILRNAKSGLCPEDCHYCSQSNISQAEVELYPMVMKEKLVEEAQLASRDKAARYCIAVSGRGPSEKQLDNLCDIISTIKRESGVSLCCSLGLLKEGQARRLKEAGLDTLNHNLNTSENYYPEICRTHTYQDRYKTLKSAKEAGISLCSGGIVGQGESRDDVIDMFLTLRDLEPASIPINFLVPIKGTPFGDKGKELNPYYCLKVLALARFINPDREIRAAGGREHHLKTLQPLALFVANSIFAGGYLTTGGQPIKEAKAMIQDLKFTYIMED